MGGLGASQAQASHLSWHLSPVISSSMAFSAHLQCQRSRESIRNPMLQESMMLKTTSFIHQQNVEILHGQHHFALQDPEDPPAFAHPARPIRTAVCSWYHLVVLILCAMAHPQSGTYQVGSHRHHACIELLMVWSLGPVQSSVTPGPWGLSCLQSFVLHELLHGVHHMSRNASHSRQAPSQGIHMIASKSPCPCPSTSMSMNLVERLHPCP